MGTRSLGAGVPSSTQADRGRHHTNRQILAEKQAHLTKASLHQAAADYHRQQVAAFARQGNRKLAASHGTAAIRHEEGMDLHRQAGYQLKGVVDARRAASKGQQPAQSEKAAAQAYLGLRDRANAHSQTIDRDSATLARHPSAETATAGSAAGGRGAQDLAHGPTHGSAHGSAGGEDLEPEDPSSPDSHAPSQGHASESAPSPAHTGSGWSMGAKIGAAALAATAIAGLGVGIAALVKPNNSSQASPASAASGTPGSSGPNSVSPGGAAPPAASTPCSTGRTDFPYGVMTANGCQPVR